jgi:8-oxo-dGTP diphosphatase
VSPEASPSRRIVVVGAVLERDGLILAARRGVGMTQPDMWEFPGGKVEPGETPAVALRREIAEELGCTVDVGEHVATCEHENAANTVILDTYRCTLVAGEPRAIEHAEIRWLAPRDLVGLPWSPADLPTVRRLLPPGQHVVEAGPSPA